MSFSIQTNVNSLIAQQNLTVNNEFQTQTITQLTSGYRINEAGDDAAGLAVANKFRNDTAELTQGVGNGNDAVAQLQIMDGGMSNISQILDRLKTLATQSASGTFTGDRNTLNSEFQDDLQEIDRQAQSVGLNTGGTFAKNLSVYLGAGSGSQNLSNALVGVNLASSTVDSASLGLKGMQVVATSGADVTAALASTTNSNSEAAAGYTNFYFSGPGFSDGSKVKVAVNLQNVNNLNTLVTAVNTAIQSASQGTGSATTAFANAGIVASAVTNSDGSQSLAFTSANSAFQVQAGDRMANAFLGNQTSNVGTAISQTVTGASTSAGSGFNATNVTVRLTGGGLASPVDISLGDLGATTTQAAIDALSSRAAANTSLAAAGISVNDPTVGSALVFTSARGDKLSVQVTGDASGQLGFGTFQSNTGGAVDYTSLTGGTYTNSAAGLGTADLEFSLNGGASSANNVSVNLTAGDATYARGTAGGTADVHGAAIDINVDGTDHNMTFAGGSTTAITEAADINANSGAPVTASVNSAGHLVITANNAGAHVVTISGAAAVSLGMNGTYTGNARSGQSIADTLNTQFNANATLAAAGMKASWNSGTSQLTLSSDNNTYFRVNTGGTTSTANVGFGTTGASGYAGPTITSAANAVADAQGTSATGALAFSPLLYGGDAQAITVSANDSSGNMQSTTITLQNVGGTGATRTGSSIDQAIGYINQQLQASNNSTLQQIVAVKEDVSGVQKINFVSALPSFSVGVAATSNSDGINSGSARTFSSSLVGTAGNLAIASQSGAESAITAISNAVETLGAAQANVGIGENQLNYAINLAQSQITNFSSAESQIRDANVAQQAANLTKAQVLQQASIAAMAQANTAPQAVLTLLRA